VLKALCVGIITNINLVGFFLEVLLKLVFFFVAACSPVIVRFRLMHGSYSAALSHSNVAFIGSFEFFFTP
jgi:hypothetical protein